MERPALEWLKQFARRRRMAELGANYVFEYEESSKKDKESRKQQAS